MSLFITFKGHIQAQRLYIAGPKKIQNQSQKVILDYKIAKYFLSKKAKKKSQNFFF